MGEHPVLGDEYVLWDYDEHEPLGEPYSYRAVFADRGGLGWESEGSYGEKRFHWTDAAGRFAHFRGPWFSEAAVLAAIKEELLENRAIIDARLAEIDARMKQIEER